MEAFQVFRAKPEAETGASEPGQDAARMIGRDAALSRLMARWRAAQAERRRQVVVVLGEAGVGKSRLINEFFSHPSLGEAAIVQTHCHEISRNSALSPISGYVWKRAGLFPEDLPDQRREKLRRFLARLGVSGEGDEVLLERVPGLGSPSPASSPEEANLFKLRQFQLIKDMVRQTVEGRPLVLSVEDAHWLDPTSAELFRELADFLDETPLLLLFTTRSFPKGPGLPAPDELIQIEPLTPEDGFELARAVPGAQHLSEDLVRRAVRAADGVPLFVEQLVLSLVEQEAASGPPGRKPGHLPLVLAELMSERLDRRQGARRIVQAAACLGRSFSPASLAVILEEEERGLRQQLDLMVDAEILRPTRYGLELRYEFRHALLQLMARELMLAPERREMHARIANFLESGANLPSPPEESAYHLTEAGLVDRAIRRWLEAGVNAARQSTHVEAIDHLRRGLALLPELPDPIVRSELELGLQVALMTSLTVTQFVTSLELSACCERGMELSRETGRAAMAFPFIFGKFTFANCSGRTDEAMTLADMFVSLSEANHYSSGLVIGHRLRGMCLLGQGRLSEAKTELNRSLGLYSAERDAGSVERYGQNPRVHAGSLLALALFCHGEVRQALVTGRDVLTAVDALRDPHSTAIALSYVGGLIFGYCGASKHLAEHAGRLNALCDQHKLGGYRPYALAFLGWAECQQGAFEPGTQKIAAAIKAFDSVEFRLALTVHLGNLSDGLRRLGRLDEAKAQATRAAGALREAANAWLEPEILRVDALIDFARSGDADEAVRAMEAAALRAREMEEPVFERRCLLSLQHEIGRHERIDVADRLRATSEFADLGGLVAEIIDPR